MSHITTHVLDTGSGQPAQDLPIQLEAYKKGDWALLGKGTTNSDGRISDLLDDDIILPIGTYRMVFNTGFYYKNKETKCFHPVVYIYFSISDDSHYHIPLLLSPFGYTTYRGS